MKSYCDLFPSGEERVVRTLSEWTIAPLVQAVEEAESLFVDEVSDTTLIVGGLFFD